jgi:hypothetical protein
MPATFLRLQAGESHGRNSRWEWLSQGAMNFGYPVPPAAAAAAILSDRECAAGRSCCGSWRKSNASRRCAARAFRELLAVHEFRRGRLQPAGRARGWSRRRQPLGERLEDIAAAHAPCKRSLPPGMGQWPCMQVSERGSRAAMKKAWRRPILSGCAGRFRGGISGSSGEMTRLAGRRRPTEENEKGSRCALWRGVLTERGSVCRQPGR